MIKGVFFDLYNTLIGYQPSREEMTVKLLAELGYTINEDDLYLPVNKADEYFYQQNAQKPISLRERAEQMAVWSHYYRIILEEIGIEPKPELINNLISRWKNLKWEMTLYQDVIPCLENLKKRNLKIGLISNAEKDMSELFNKTGLNKYLETVVISQEVGVTKPNPLIFQAALKKSGLTAKEVLYIGDQYQVDYMGAMNVGLNPVLLDRRNCYLDLKDCRRITGLAELEYCIDNT
ncbi:MAG: HAD-superfamily hydrolase, subfamily IA [Dehalococcoides mccartyi]|uniref:HAD family hydrolase n=2 Tax=Dehalococcoides mccartyi TaxID=61435 RepID=A0A0V8M4F4_9CHLR|nr:HAD family hydrolase [Dehalococcoides mccartyi]AAW40185.1 HAD-superfamily hydrolase, subfamily IA [Dehalococcoides mccartyi 195]AII59217.1 HAD family hydrolase [Dehalococcoides mccartyi CG4]KSV18658.1 HAD family hydrolase [Dehalococcoides mccartyi]MCF7635185.1 HAD-superfamily hydrolase, subfamily IA [Dehalococcoides mccartyi]MEA2121284.1 Pyrimidine 5'-nucleotidase YjjG [Dehalococcoides mccartyi]